MYKLFIVFLFLFTPFLAISQTINEKMIVDLSSIQNVEPYSLNYDTVTGSYLYQNYDTVTKKSTLYSNKGNSGIYDNIDYYNAIFDKDGNYYVIAYNSVTDTTFTYFILKNGNEIAKYDKLNTNWAEKNGLIYFVSVEDGKSSLVVYNIAMGNFSKGKAYDDILLCYFQYRQEEGEPDAQIGFTKEGNAYYIGQMNNEKFLVIGTEEQKHYSDIDAYNFTLDNEGNPCFIAKSKGELYNAGNTLLVQGSKEYKTYDYINGPVIFDKSNNPIYIAADSTKDNTPQRVVVGDREEKTYKGGVFNIALSPTGKLTYTATDYKPNGDSYTFVVLDGKEGKKYYSINAVKFAEGDQLLYIAGKDEENSVIVRGTTETEVDYPTILYANILSNGKLVYVCGEYANYDKKIKGVFYLHIGEDEYGPYDGMLPVSNTENQYLIYDKAGNYMYLTEKMMNLKDYTTHQILYSGNGKSKEFDYIDNSLLYKGKPLYVGTTNIPDSKTYASKARIYYDNKPISPEYDSINNFQFNESTGTISYNIVKNKAFYKVEIKM